MRNGPMLALFRQSVSGAPTQKNGGAGLGGGDIYQEAKRDIKGYDAKYFYPF
jgi:hypothetical protein